MWVGDTEADALLDEVTKLHCFVVKKFQEDEWIIATRLDEVKPEYRARLDKVHTIEWREHTEIQDIINERIDHIHMHNLFGYDLEMLKMLGYIEDYDIYPQHLGGKSCVLTDTLSMSRALSPDRLLPPGCPSKVFNPVTQKMDTIGPHGLMAWGFRAGGKKPKVDDWRNQPLEVYLSRCVEDVIINEGALVYMRKEASSIALGGTGWEQPLLMTNKADYLMNKQERDGVLFDKVAALLLVERIDKMMEELAEEVEPKLPPRVLPKSEQANFPTNPITEGNKIKNNGWNHLKKLGYVLNEEAMAVKKVCAKPWKGNSELSASGIKWFTDEGIDLDDKKACRAHHSAKLTLLNTEPLEPEEYARALVDLRAGKMPPLATGPTRMGNGNDIKEWLFKETSWVPLLWNTKDASRGPDKQNLPTEEVEKKIGEWLDKTSESVYNELIWDEMGIDPEKESDLMGKLVRKARFLVTSPKLKDERGDLCKNLERIDGDLGKAIVKWLSLRNRRSVLKAMDETKLTGWLNNSRLEVDGRLGQGYSGLTPTNRYKHRNIVNLPKADPSVLLGHEMRSMFIARPGYKILGYDGSNLEQFVAGHYSMRYDGGDYAESLAGDSHTTNAAAYTKAAGRKVGRSEGKNITYGILYGASAPKISKMLGIPLRKAKLVVDAFWDTNIGLKNLRDALIGYWEKTGKKYILAIDGRKIYTRSKHSLVNALFQSCGSLIMFLSGCYMYDMLKDEGLIDEGVVRLVFVHDEYQYEVPDHLIEEKIFDTEEEAKAWEDGRLWSNVREIDGKYYRWYCIVGELGDKSLQRAGEFYNMRMAFRAAYDIGDNLAETH